MKITCTQENLNRGLSIVSHIASKNITLPILNNVLITAKNGKILLTTTNLEIGVNCQIRGKIEEEGKVTIQAKLLADYVNSLPNEKVDLALDKDNLKIHCGRSETVIKSMSSEEFPLIPKVTQKNNFKVGAKDFKKSLMQVLFAAAQDESRPEISGVFVKPSNKEVVLAATDSYRLAEKKLKSEKEVKESEGVIVPTRTFQELIRILDDTVESIDFYVNENQILFTFDGIELVSRLIEGQYPDYRQIIPTDYKTQATLNNRDFIKVIKTASLFCQPSINDINLEFLPEGKIVVSASNAQLGENISSIETKLEGEKNNIVFNYRYLLDGLSNIDSEEVIIELTNSSSPGTIKSKEAKDYLYIIMPIRQ